MKSPSKISSILKKLLAKNPDAHCELYYRTPYQLLVSVVLSAQATDRSVNQAMKPLYDEGLEPEDVLKMGQENFLKKIRTIGLAPTKSRNVLRLTEILLKEHGGNVPRTREELEDLPGVGRKTANVILGEIYGEPTLAVDTHVYRVTTRLGLQHESSPEKAELALLKIIPKKFLPKAHHLFILHGRYTCVAKKPKCSECVLAKLCPSAESK